MEKHLEAKIVNLARALGLRCTKFIDQSRIGAPDRILWYPRGKLLFVETKFGANGPSKHQLEYHRILRSEGHPVLCSDDYGEIESVMRYFHARK